ncbi:ATP-dependent RNA helicase [Hirschfeldia incana]|nr:ATP-dependent RNA helicase [Hirschfeldia incana]
MMQNCSLSNRRRSFSDRTLEINSHISVPCHLKQCLDLKTGEIYYINRNTGMRVMEDNNNNAYDDFSGESDATVVSEDDSSYYESEESSSESSLENHKDENDVLVVAGCKACYIYYMVPKLLKDCPKCAAQLLHFDQHHSASP